MFLIIKKIWEIKLQSIKKENKSKLTDGWLLTPALIHSPKHTTHSQCFTNSMLRIELCPTPRICLTPVSVNITLFGNRVFADVFKTFCRRIKRRSRLGPYQRRRWGHRHTQRQGPRDDAMGCICKWRDPKDASNTSGQEKSLEWSLPGSSREHSPVSTLISGFQNRERLHFCSFKAPSWYFVIAALGNQYTL